MGRKIVKDPRAPRGIERFVFYRPQRPPVLRVSKIPALRLTSFAQGAVEPIGFYKCIRGIPPKGALWACLPAGRTASLEPAPSEVEGLLAMTATENPFPTWIFCPYKQQTPVRTTS